MQYIGEELTKRAPVYTKADWVIDANGSIEETLLKIMELI